MPDAASQTNATSATASVPGAAAKDSEGRAREVHRVTVGGLIANMALSVVKFIIGFIAQSQALVADGVHSLSDSATDVAVVIGVRYWSAPADAEHPHGHGRIETLISLFIGVALAGVGVGLAWRAISTLHQYHLVSPGGLAFWAACLSIVTKEWLYRWTVRVGRRVKSPAMIANAWHHRSDALSSVPVAVAVLGTRIQPTWGFLDHIATVLVSALILHASWGIAWPALRQLIDAGADREARERIITLALGTDQVQAVHALRTRHVGPGLAVDLHVLVEPTLSVREGHAIAGAVKQRLLAEGPDIVDVLLHVEPFEGSERERNV